MSKYLKTDNPDDCISCNICLTACPVAKATREYRGPKLTGPALSRLRMLIEDDDPMLQFCSNCKNCDRVCPSGTPISTLNMKARYKSYEKKPHSMAEKILANNETMGKMLTSIPFMPVLANTGMKIASKLNMMEIVGVYSKAPLPKYANTSFYNLYKKYKQKECEKKVLFFPGCYVNYNEPQVGIDLIKVLNKNNIQVVVDPRFKCCGSPMISAGYLDKVENNAKHNVQILHEYAQKGYDIVTTCTTCLLILKQEYQELFDLPQVKEYAPKMYDSIELLECLHQENKLDTNFKPLAIKQIYHTPCHLKVQGFGRPTLNVLKLIPNLQIEDANAGCCGLSGIYGYKCNTAKVAAIVGSKLQQTIKNSEAQEGICECNICRLQMQNGTGKSARHPLSVLSQAYGL